MTQRLDINAIALAWHERGTGDGVPLAVQLEIERAAVSHRSSLVHVPVG